jgi:catechol 2,3-dioxygenase-like lactoylglutathione lyase family enzyme
MIQIQGIYEVAVRVRDLAAAEPFYRNVLGLEVGLRDEKRKGCSCARAASRMIVLQEDGANGPLQRRLHRRARSAHRRAPAARRHPRAARSCTSDSAKSLFTIRRPDLELCAPLG